MIRLEIIGLEMIWLELIELELIGSRVIITNNAVNFIVLSLLYIRKTKGAICIIIYK